MGGHVLLYKINESTNASCVAVWLDKDTPFASGSGQSLEAAAVFAKCPPAHWAAGGTMMQGGRFTLLWNPTDLRAPSRSGRESSPRLSLSGRLLAFLA